MTTDTMSKDGVIALRKALGLTQTELADRLGMTLRSLQDIETGPTKVKLVHHLALERIALSLGVSRRDIGVVPSAVRRDALELARLISGE